MAALVVPGAPVSVLLDHGLTEAVIEKLLESGVGTVEKLGSMTPEELEQIPDIELSTVERIQLAVNSYYSQFELAMESEETPAAPQAEAAQPAETMGEALPSPPEESAEESPAEATVTKAAPTTSTEDQSELEVIAVENAPETGPFPSPVPDQSGVGNEAGDDNSEAGESGTMRD
jgi:N utilization substance protein A